MVKVLVVDDEQPVLDGVQFLINKFRPDLVICGTAKTGREAIEKAKALRPDILITDIKMPGITGLEALRDIRQELPKLITLVFSAYERFEMAQEAFELGVQDYLLKPLAKDKFLNALDRAVERREELRQTLDWGLSLKEKWESSLGFLEQALVLWAQNPDSLTDEGENIRVLLEITQPIGQFLIFEFGPIQDPEARLNFLELKSALSFKCDLVFGPFRSNRFCAIFKYHSIDQPDLNDIPPSVQAALKQFPDWKVSAGKPRPWNSLFQSYSQALAQGLSFELDPSNDLIEKEKDLLNALLAQNLDHLSMGLRSLGESLIDPDLFWEIFTLILHEAAIQGWTVQPSKVYRKTFEEPHPWNQKVNFLSEAPFSWGPPKQQTLTREPSPTLQKALTFISSQFQSPLSLDDAAKAAGVHPQYLSRLFSMELGESFVEYLTRLRMAKAKDLLASGTSVKEVCYSLGYSDPNYFSRVFKKSIGKTPVEFTLTARRNHS